MLKPPASFFEPDARFKYIVAINPDSGESRKIGYADLYADVASLSLDEPVPQDIRDQFDLARNVYVYSWFVYEFATVAERQAYTALEAGLRHRHHEETGGVSRPAGLKDLFDHAVDRGWLDASEYEVPAPWMPNGKISRLDIIRVFRNSLAHGKFHLMPDGSLTAIWFCHSIISQLFTTKGGP